MDELDKLFNNIKKLDKQVIDNKNSNIIFPNETKLSKTPEEAVQEGRKEAIKQYRPFDEPNGEATEEEIEDSIERYVKDVLEKLI